MTDPYEVLNLSPLAEETEIRRRYLELVRRFSPEREPEQFAAIHAAYEAVRNPTTRLEALLFRTSPDDSVDSIALELRKRLRDCLDQLPINVLLSLAQS